MTPTLTITYFDKFNQVQKQDVPFSYIPDYNQVTTWVIKNGGKQLIAYKVK